MASLLRQLALVSESKHIRSSDLQKVSAAIQKQATRDLAPIWDIAATADSFDKLEDVPVGYWPIIIMDDIGVDGAAGVHEDKNGQPFALVRAAASIDEWSLTVSHEALEMLVDPFGNRLMAGDSPKPDQGRVSFLVEVADPPESAEFAYTANGVLVSDFYTPRYFDPLTAPGVRYSFTGAITEPRQVLRGGYLSWQEPVSGHWWQEIFFDSEPEFRDLGPIDAKAQGNLRAAIDRQSAELTAQAIAAGRPSARAAGLNAAVNQSSANSFAAVWRAQIAEITGKPGRPKAAARSAKIRQSPSVY